MSASPNEPHRRPAPVRRHHNLPLALSRFVGRERELRAVREALLVRRLVTLAGTGGVGKTRLAIEAARGLVDRFADGVRLVELAPLVDAALVPQAVAATLGVTEQPGRPLEETLIEALRQRDLLLILDNCEHLVAACASLVDALLRACPGVRVLATSREPLHVSGEEVRRVPSLAVPPLANPDSGAPDHGMPPLAEAVQLFLDRARTIRPDTELSAGALAAAGEICRRLDGIPLAIELAAARLELLAPEQIAERLDERFRLLTLGDRTATSRHRTLRALVDWSHDLLSEPERVLFRRLAPFAGGWELEAAEAVCTGPGMERGRILDVLGLLVNKSLVLAGADAGRAHYCLLETLREYARERLVEAGEESATRQNHLDWCIALVERAEAGLHGPDQPSWLQTLEREQENLRAALQWSLAEVDQAEAGLRLAAGLAWYWFVTGRFREGRLWLERGLLASAEMDAMSGPARRWRAKALLGAGRLAHYQGEYDRARAMLEESLALARGRHDWAGTAAASTALGHLALDRGDYDAARRLCEGGLTLSVERGDATAAGPAFLLLGRIARAEGEPERARTFFRRALSTWRSEMNTWGMAWALSYLGLLAIEQGTHEQAESLLGQSLKLATDLRDTRGIGLALVGLGQAARRHGDLATAEARIRESLRLHHELGDRWSIAQCLDELAWIAAERRPGWAVELFAAARSLREAIGAPLPPAEADAVERTLAGLREEVGEATFATAWSAGANLPTEQVLAAPAEPSAPGLASVPASALDASQDTRDVLTRREAEVAVLIARGYTNRQIADALVISERTAETHARNIREKLGFATRSQVAGWAVRHGLADEP